jgi:hypothetical protein
MKVFMAVFSTVGVDGIDAAGWGEGAKAFI